MNRALPLLLFLSLLVLSAAPARAQFNARDSASVTLVLLPLSPTAETDPNIPYVIEAYLDPRLARSLRRGVSLGDEVQKVLRLNDVSSVSDCVSDRECVRLLGSQFNASLLVDGVIDQRGDNLRAALTWYATGNGLAVRRDQIDFALGKEKVLLDALVKGHKELFPTSLKLASENRAGEGGFIALSEQENRERREEIERNTIEAQYGERDRERDDDDRDRRRDDRVDTDRLMDRSDPTADLRALVGEGDEGKDRGTTARPKPKRRKQDRSRDTASRAAPDERDDVDLSTFDDGYDDSRRDRRVRDDSADDTDRRSRSDRRDDSARGSDQRDREDRYSSRDDRRSSRSSSSDDDEPLDLYESARAQSGDDELGRRDLSPDRGDSDVNHAEFLSRGFSEAEYRRFVNKGWTIDEYAQKRWSFAQRLRLTLALNYGLGYITRRYSNTIYVRAGNSVSDEYNWESPGFAANGIGGTLGVGFLPVDGLEVGADVTVMYGEQKLQLQYASDDLGTNIQAPVQTRPVPHFVLDVGARAFLPPLSRFKVTAGGSFTLLFAQGYAISDVQPPLIYSSRPAAIYVGATPRVGLNVALNPHVTLGLDVLFTIWFTRGEAQFEDELVHPGETAHLLSDQKAPPPPTQPILLRAVFGPTFVF